MFNSWTLENFKSIGTKVRLDFRPLTVFTGPNNSGKSTVIQSLLLTAQTLQSQVHARPVVLNAQMARLGDYSDIVHGGNQSKDITIGFSLELRSAYQRRRTRSRRYRHTHYYFPGFASADTTTISFDYSFGSDSSERSERLKSQLKTVNMEVRTINLDDESDKLANIRATRAKKSPSQRLDEYSLVPAEQSEHELDSLAFQVDNVFPRETPRRRRTLVGKEYFGATFDHFLPRHLSAIYDTVATEVRTVYKALTSPKSYEWESAEDQIEAAFSRPPLRDLLLEAVERLLESLSSRTDNDDRAARYMARTLQRLEDRFDRLTHDCSPSEWADLYGSLPPSLRGTLTEEIEDREAEIKEAIRAGRTVEYELTPLMLPELLRQGSAALQRQLSYSLHYIGPLRDEPKSIYPLTGSTDPNDVGLKGEHTAAVLDLNRDLVIEYIPPGPSDQSIVEQEPTDSSLIQAVTEWLKYVGVGSDVDTRDQGKLGHELKVETSATNALHDLTQVGVGVSQVLPILVSSLLAGPGAILIFEQPELHLHPKVQARLADFFISMTELGKQCIVETHSEYLINRLRFQIAKSHGSELSDEIIVYFTEKEEGESRYRPVEINKFGKVEGWPRGFFDEGERLTASILRAGLDKRESDE